MEYPDSGGIIRVVLRNYVASVRNGAADCIVRSRSDVDTRVLLVGNAGRTVSGEPDVVTLDGVSGSSRTVETNTFLTVAGYNIATWCRRVPYEVVGGLNHNANGVPKRLRAGCI